MERGKEGAGKEEADKQRHAESTGGGQRLSCGETYTRQLYL